MWKIKVPANKQKLDQKLVLKEKEDQPNNSKMKFTYRPNIRSEQMILEPGSDFCR
jgi:hypothetical protein